MIIKCRHWGCKREFDTASRRNQHERDAHKPKREHCQNGGDVCLAGSKDTVCCPDDSCDIDDGLRAVPNAT